MKRKKTHIHTNTLHFLSLCALNVKEQNNIRKEKLQTKKVETDNWVCLSYARAHNHSLIVIEAKTHISSKCIEKIHFHCDVL